MQFHVLFYSWTYIVYNDKLLIYALWLYSLFPCNLFVFNILPDFLYLFHIIMPVMCSFVIRRLPTEKKKKKKKQTTFFFPFIINDYKVCKTTSTGTF